MASKVAPERGLFARIPALMTKTVTAAAAALVLLAACGKKDGSGAPPAPAKPRPEKLPNGEPAVITVKHILIGVKDERRGQFTRTEEEARELAYDLLRRARTGEDFEKLRKEYTDDKSPQAPESYTLVNEGVDPVGEESSRRGMIPAFGDVGFRLNVGEIGVAPYDPTTSPYGYHLILRVK